MNTTPPKLNDSVDVISIDDVRLRYILRKDNSLKERMVTFGRSGRRHREEFWALDGVTTTIQAGTTVALIGHNGSGKSTLLKLIGGIMDTTSGTIKKRGRIAALLELGAGFHIDLTGRENVYLNAAILGLNREETEQQFDSIVEFAGIGDFIDTQVKFYSSGMYVRLAFAVAVHTNPDILLIDEVLAVGDEAFQRKCLDKIREFQHEGRTIILVTHALEQVIDLCDRALLLNSGKVQFDGNPSEAVEAFRNILEDRRKHEAEAHSGKTGITATAVVEAIIHNAACWPAGRSGSNQIQLGDDIEIEVNVSYFHPEAGWQISLDIDNAKGQTVYSTSTERLKAKPTFTNGQHTIRFIVKDSRLGSGMYWVNVSLISETGRKITRLRQACSFNATGGEASTGTIYLDAQYSEVNNNSSNESPASAITGIEQAIEDSPERDR